MNVNVYKIMLYMFVLAFCYFEQQTVKEGVYVRGLYLEGGGWDSKLLCLTEPIPMELIYNMPVILFRPCEQLKRKPKGTYVCPSYYFPLRANSPQGESFVVAIDLKSGSETADHWIKRGTAILLSLSY